jgi:hypothetical protein
LQWNINRWYDSNIGKWMSEDPIGVDGKDVNFFRYSYNNVKNYIDRFGFNSDQPSPPNIQRQEECCSEVKAKKTQQERTMGGSVVCCDGFLVSCNWHIDKDTAKHNKVQKILNDCIIEHENYHRDNDFNKCKSCEVYQPDMKYWLTSSSNKAECKAFQVQINCMKKSLVGLTQNQKDRLINLMDRYIQYGNNQYNCKQYNLEIKR